MNTFTNVSFSSDDSMEAMTPMDATTAVDPFEACEPFGDEDEMSDFEVQRLLESTGGQLSPYDPTPTDASPGIVKPVDWAKLRSGIPPRTWWMQDWLTTSPTLIAGAGGKGKSLLMQQICTSLATGTEFLTPVPTRLRCMIWSCEDDENEILRRQAAINAHFGLHEGELGNLRMVPRGGRDNVLCGQARFRLVRTALFEQLRQQVNDEEIDVLVLDNISQVFGGVSADAHQVASFVNDISSLVAGRPFAPILVGHVARTLGSEFAGSAGWENSVRMRWHLSSTPPGEMPDEDDRTDGVVYLSRRKSNYSQKGHLKLQFNNGVLAPALGVGAFLSPEDRDALHDEIVLEACRHLESAREPISLSQKSPSWLVRQMVNRKCTKGATIRDLAASLDRLLASGRLVRTTGKYTNGTVRTDLLKLGSL